MYGVAVPVDFYGYNTGLQLITVRHFNKDVIAKLTESKTVLLEQLSRHTAQLVVREV